jgi:hypothetical protein
MNRKVSPRAGQTVLEKRKILYPYGDPYPRRSSLPVFVRNTGREAE